MGFPDELWEELYGDQDAKAVIVAPPDPYKVDTELVVEMELAMDLVGSMAEWDRLCWAERRMWMYMRTLQNRKRSRHEEHMKEEYRDEMERLRRNFEANKRAKTNTDRPGVRR